MSFSLHALEAGYSPACFAAFLLCLVLIGIMIRIGVMDHPVTRSAHREPTPKGGGVGIVAAFLTGLPLQQFLLHLPVLEKASLFLCAGVLLLAVVSWLDDVYSFPARYKLGAQFLAAALAACGNGLTPELFVAAVAGSVLLTNAVNFMDGLNGLAGGVILLSAVALAGASIAPAVFVLLGFCVLAFLPCNFPKARLFMGDVGSQSCALILAWGGMQAHSVAPWLLPCLTTGLLWDVLFTLARRALAGERLAEAHRGHLYQLAVRTGLKMPAVSLLHWGFVLWGAFVFSTGAFPLALGLLLLPQLVWTGWIYARASRLLHERW